MDLAGLRPVRQKISEDFVIFPNLRNGDIRDRDVDVKFDSPKSKDFAGRQNFFGDTAAVDETAIGGADVAERNTEFRNMHFAMRAGNAWIENLDVVAGVAADAVEAGAQFNCHAGVRTVPVN